MNIDITEIIIALIGVLVTIITSVIVPVVVPWLKTKLSTNQIEIVKQLASVAVYAAQQIYTSDEAQKKKEYAIAYVKEELAKYNITFSEDTISTYIEGVLKNIKVDEGAEW
ncbi:MAG: phage holin [Candidatus Ornithomonoglobus sp.]